MNPTFIKARDLPDLWFQLLQETVEKGRIYTVKKGDGTERRMELDFMSAQVAYPNTRPLVPDIPPSFGFPPPVTMEYVEQYLPYYMTGEKAEGEHYTYGEDLHWQIEWVIDYYKKHGESARQCYMAVGRPESLFFYDDTVDYVEFVSAKKRYGYDHIVGRQIDNFFNEHQEGSGPCLRGIDTAIKYGALHFSIHFRSWNLWNGLPANLACLQLVKEYMADRIGVKDGEMFVTCLKLSLQESVWGFARRRVGKED